MFISRLFAASPLGMNARNCLIRRLNSPAALRLAKDKVSFKEVLQKNGIATPQSYHVIHDYTDMRLIGMFPDEFVVKPARGYGGNGIILLHKANGGYVNPSGDRYTTIDVKWHIRKILDGEFSGYIERDQAIIEERIYPSAKLQFKDAIGLLDIRVFCYRFQPIMGMLRYPTLASKGRANLSRGALGIGLDLATGTITYIHSKKYHKEYSPEEFGIPSTFVMPLWDEMKQLAIRCAELADLLLCGVDIVLSDKDIPMVLEVNGRPGLEIQNINESSLIARFKTQAYKPRLAAVG
ncbi:MAG: hypothetical protein HY670_06285 [Chloroflexi bacterium]|nr:hypothetical protein [Chloroflexota bacterium]